VLAHPRKLRPLVRREIGEAEQLSGAQQRVLGDEVFDLRRGFRVERVIGDAHVGELGVAAAAPASSGERRSMSSISAAKVFAIGVIRIENCPVSAAVMKET
jgi:hypothetical protein